MSKYFEFNFKQLHLIGVIQSSVQNELIPKPMLKDVNRYKLIRRTEKSRRSILQSSLYPLCHPWQPIVVPVFLHSRNRKVHKVNKQPTKDTKMYPLICNMHSKTQFFQWIFFLYICPPASGRHVRANLPFWRVQKLSNLYIPLYGKISKKQDRSTHGFLRAGIDCSGTIL